jgi:hypothetical protein
MSPRYLISGFAAFLVVFMGGWAVHGMLLTDDYMQTPQLFRDKADTMAHFPFTILAYLVLGFAFAWIYRQGIASGSSWLMQGIRFGFAVGCLVAFPMYLIYYVVQPMALTTVIKQIVGDTVFYVVAGVVVAFINMKEARASSES